MLLRNYSRRLAEEAVEQRYEDRLLRKDGAVSWVELNGALIDWNGSPAIPATPRTRTVMLTSLANRGDAKLFAEAGFSAYLTKPVRSRVLLGVLSLVHAGGKGAASDFFATRHTVGELEYASLSRFRGKRYRVLVVEDNLTNRQVAVGILEKLDIAADTVENGQQAVESVRNTHYDLLLMDVQMPVIDGLEA